MLYSIYSIFFYISMYILLLSSVPPRWCWSTKIRSGTSSDVGAVGNSWLCRTTLHSSLVGVKRPLSFPFSPQGSSRGVGRLWVVGFFPVFFGYIIVLSTHYFVQQRKWRHLLRDREEGLLGYFSAFSGWWILERGRDINFHEYRRIYK